MTRLNEQQIEIMKDELAVELADWLMETYGYSAAEALDIDNNWNINGTSTWYYTFLLITPPTRYLDKCIRKF